MKSRISFSIPSLVAAGLVPLSAAASSPAEMTAEDDKAGFDTLRNIVQDIGESHSYTLAQHRSHASHQSHGSHGSHQSHRSASFRAPGVGDGGVQLESVGYPETRNEDSTPPSAILPSSPAIAKKLKVLPGNSAKFEQLVTRVQLALATRGYDVGEVDGRMHARAIAAVYLYQQDQGMIPSGKITSEVLSSLAIVAQ
jgi:His-Xaa-Ser repeat protein HxsA